MSINKVLDHDVKVIKKDLTELINLTKKQYENTYEAVSNNDLALAKKTAQGDKTINDKQNNFTQMVLWKIAKQQMVAGDLRLAVGSIIISREIEKIADYAKSIDWHLMDMNDTGVKSLLWTKDNFHYIIDMLTIIESLIDNYDKDLTTKVKNFEEELAVQFAKARTQIIEDIRSSKTEKEALDNYVSLRQFKKLERAADHIISIEEVLDFIRTGKFDDKDKFKQTLDNYSDVNKK